MAVRFQRKVKAGKNRHVNVSKSGLSVSQKAGRFTFNSRGTVSYNSSVKGLSFRMNIGVALLFIPTYWMFKALWFFVTLPFKATWFLLKLPFKLLKKKKEE
tara:strand:- start:1064 stop:1366 length:303 start_codon:yes stop_codon:yes gene_type:complete